MESRTDWGAAAEAGAVFAAILAYIWWARFVWGPSWIGILAVILISHRLRREGPVELGFRVAGLWRAFLDLLPVLALVLAVLLAAGLAFGTPGRFSAGRLAANLGRYLAWGLFQQYLLNGYFVNRLSRVFGSGRAAAPAAFLFAAAHAPNLFLMAAALAGGYVSARLYGKYRNLYLLGFLHGVIGWTLHLAAPGWLTHEFLVGPRFFER